MPALPAITFMGLRGMTAWLALGAAGVGGYVVATRVVPSLVGGGTRSGATPAASGAPNAQAFELVGGLARALGESSARVAISTLGPAASIATEGVRLAGDVSEVLGRVTERSTTVLGDVARESMRANTRQSEALIDLLTHERPTARGETFLPPTRREPERDAELGTSAPPPPRAPVVVTAPSTSVRLAPSEVTAGITREVEARGETLEQHLAKVNIPALFSSPGVVVTDADRAAVAAGRTPLYVKSDGSLVYAEGA